VVAYKVPSNFQLLIVPDPSTCLSWDQKLDPVNGPSGSLVFGDPPTHACYVQHNGFFKDTNGNRAATQGPRVGQVRLEGSVWVCRFEFYYEENVMTYTNQPGEDTRVLDLVR
jgi:hypothetical protein